MLRMAPLLGVLDEATVGVGSDLGALHAQIVERREPGELEMIR